MKQSRVSRTPEIERLLAEAWVKLRNRRPLTPDDILLFRQVCGRLGDLIAKATAVKEPEVRE